MGRLNFAQSSGSDVSGNVRPAKFLFLFAASAICSTWMLETILRQAGF